MTATSLLLPSHGHAPYLLGVNLLRNLSVNICVPHYYGITQRRILGTEFPNDGDKIFLSESLGTLLKPLLRDRSYSPKFGTYALNVSRNIKTISDLLKNCYLDGIDAVSLDGTKKRFTEFNFALNTGLPIFSPMEPVFFAFAGRMSAIYELSPYQSPEIKSLARIWSQIESSFDRMFVPRLNSLSYLDYDETGITFSPPFAKPYPLDNTPIPHDSILVVASGTGLDFEKLLVFADSSPSPCLTLSESPSIIDLPRVHSKSWGNPNIVAVLARSGLGSIWQAFINLKPIGVVKPPSEDDPEIIHNAKMVQETGIGTILEKNVGSLINALPLYLSEIQKQLEIVRKKFCTIDGIEYTSGKLKDMLYTRIIE